jgi:hypothetical protein
MLFLFSFPTLAYIGGDAMMDGQIGVKFRLGFFNTDHEMKSKDFGVHVTDGERQFRTKIPTIIAFKEKVHTEDARFTKIFFDFELPYKSRNQIPGGKYNKQKIYDSFFTNNERALADANPNWQLSGDIETASFVVGYTWGVYIPIKKREDIRILKTSVGLMTGWYQLDYSLNFCKSFSEADPNATISGSDVSFGNCEGKQELENFSYNGFGYGVAFAITAFERVINKYQTLAFFEIDAGVIIPLNSNKVDTRAYAPKFELNTSYINVDFVNWTYYF